MQKSELSKSSVAVLPPLVVQMKQKMIAQAKANADKVRIGYTAAALSPVVNVAAAAAVPRPKAPSAPNSFIGSAKSMGMSLKDQIKSSSLLAMSEKARPGKPSVGLSMLKMTVKVTCVPRMLQTFLTLYTH
jgi:hypothetical protein